jgi:hypothetical protein
MLVESSCADFICSGFGRSAKTQCTRSWSFNRHQYYLPLIPESISVAELIFYTAPIARGDVPRIRIIAPVSTVLYAPKAHADGSPLFE